MKRSFLLLLGICALAINTNATVARLELTNGRKLTGECITYNDTNVVIQMEGAYQSMNIPANKIASGSLDDGSLILIENGKIVVRSKADIKYQKQQAESMKMQNPNYAIGKAIKTSGTVALAIGVPCFTAGIATCIAGHVKGSKSTLVARANCAEASYYLFGTGAALTIVGIPLYVQGKKIMDVKVQCSENGAGVALNF